MPETPARTPDTCPWRAVLPNSGGDHPYACGLAVNMTGASQPEDCLVSLWHCRECCGLPLPSAELPRAVVASLVLDVAFKVKAGVKVPGVDKAKLDRLETFALQHLVTLPPLSGPLSIPPPPAGYSGPCQYLGDMTGTRLCKECTGRVRLKVYQCRHPLHGETTLAECRECPDYDGPAAQGLGGDWAVGITTAPRKAPTLRQTLHSLRAAGWAQKAYVFAEAGSARRWQLSGAGVVDIVRRHGPPLGAWPNFLLSLAELHMRHPNAEAYLMLQDDVVLCRGLREYLEHSLWPGPRPGVVSLHTPKHHSRSDGAGFYAADLGWSAWGAQAYVFSNAAVRALLSDARAANHRQRGRGEGQVNVDSVVGDWCRRTGRTYFLHAPSLAEHTGATSTLWHGGKLTGRRISGDFPGGDADAREFMPVLQARGGGPPPDIRMERNGSIVPQAAGLPPAPNLPDWPALRLDIVTVTIGRAWVWKEWSHWLLTADIPPHTCLHLVNNLPAADTQGLARLIDFQAECLSGGRFQTVSVMRGPGPAGARGAEERDQNTAHCLNLGLAAVRGECVFILDDDVIPPPHALRTLYDRFVRLSNEGARPAAVSGAYASATHPGLLVAARDVHRWRDCPRPDELVPGEVMRIGFAGNGCLLVDRPALEAVLPLSAGGDPSFGRLGADAWLCRELTRHGHSLWLDCGVICQHLHSAPAGPR